MATRSFPIQVINAELDKVLERTAANMFAFKEIPAKTAQGILVNVGTRKRLPVDNTRAPFDVMDRFKQAWSNIEGVLSLTFIKPGDSEIVLDSRDAVDLSILEAFNSGVEAYLDSMAQA